MSFVPILALTVIFLSLHNPLCTHAYEFPIEQQSATNTHKKKKKKKKKKKNTKRRHGGARALSRAASIGRINMAGTIGYTAGPLLGGALASWLGAWVPAALACAVLWLDALVAFSLIVDDDSITTVDKAHGKSGPSTPKIQETRQKRKHEEHKEHKEHELPSSPQQQQQPLWRRFATDPALLPVVLLIVICLAASSSMSTRTTYLVAHLRVPSVLAGAVASLTSLGGVIAQSWGVRAIVGRPQLGPADARTDDDGSNSDHHLGGKTHRHHQAARKRAEWRGVVIAGTLSAVALALAGAIGGCDGIADTTSNDIGAAGQSTLEPQRRPPGVWFAAYALCLVAGQALAGIAKTCVKALVSRARGDGGAARALGFAATAESGAKIAGPALGGLLLFAGRSSPHSFVDFFGASALAAVALAAAAIVPARHQNHTAAGKSLKLE
jgi:hypothetical protein